MGREPTLRERFVAAVAARGGEDWLFARLPEIGVFRLCKELGGFHFTHFYRWMHADPIREARWFAMDPFRMGNRGFAFRPRRAQRDAARRARAQAALVPSIEELL